MDDSDVEPEQWAWTSHPLRDESPCKSVALGAAIFGSAAVMAYSLEHLAYGIICLGVLVISTAGYLLPTRYILDAHGAAYKQLVWRRRPWTTFRRAVRHPDGIFLSPFRQPNRLESFRGLFLRFGADGDTDRINLLVKSHVPD